ncbi:DUF6691 family protein [Thioclava nitratireducens]|uniref:YeeE/YedE family protein n=1 Tax=Thioclava nitratireducens TaxID=1915078 RepID=A0ABN4XC50_9RHOB|nr:DUF6691 family protein [Thioclava nitratireducens]AQS47707.1 hypothetical protein BMG03_07770 [Thioclava nitratireducens]WGT50812.1 hypothetical protein P0N61_01935 [Thioclava nitratireducens]
MRNVFAFLSGGLFGAGLLVAGMVDTKKVQGWLDVFGDWDPTLAFVMGGAVSVMAFVWIFAKRRETSMLGSPMPGPFPRLVDRNLVLGSLLFGAGWGLAGLCPGPAMGSLSFNGWEGWLFLIAMGVGMALAPRAKVWLSMLDRSTLEVPPCENGTNETPTPPAARGA